MNITWSQLFSDKLQAWLQEPDSINPGVRYFTLVDFLGLPADSPQALEARAEIMRAGPVPKILAHQHPDGYWVKPGYYPKYTGTYWTLGLLAMLGADGADPRIRKAGNYVLDHARCSYGGFSADGPSGLIHCLQGNLINALILLDWLGDPRLDEAIDWLARSISGEGIAPAEEKTAKVRYYRSGNCAPGFACSANNYKPCAWGAVKALLALARVPAGMRTPAIQRGIDMGVDFLLSVDPASAEYPTPFGTKPSRSWFQFGLPVGYVTDVLQILEALTLAGYARDPRLENALKLVLAKRDDHNRWKMEYTYNGKTWVDVEIKGEASKWVTLRALRVLKAALPESRGGR
jgi:hypothetical protein